MSVQLRYKVWFLTITVIRVSFYPEIFLAVPAFHSSFLLCYLEFFMAVRAYNDLFDYMKSSLLNNCKFLYSAIPPLPSMRLPLPNISLNSRITAINFWRNHESWLVPVMYMFLMFLLVFTEGMALSALINARIFCSETFLLNEISFL